MSVGRRLRAAWGGSSNFRRAALALSPQVERFVARVTKDESWSCARMHAGYYTGLTPHESQQQPQQQQHQQKLQRNQGPSRHPA